MAILPQYGEVEYAKRIDGIGSYYILTDATSESSEE